MNALLKISPQAPAVVDRLLGENARLPADNGHLAGYKDGTDGRTGTRLYI